MKNFSLIFGLLILASISKACLSADNNGSDAPVWENDLFDRIGEAPVEEGFLRPG